MDEMEQLDFEMIVNDLKGDELNGVKQDFPLSANLL